MSGPSGAGKGTLIARALPRFPHLRAAVSATTRARREGETDGVEYHFMSSEDFDAAVAADEFLEHVEYAGNRYGTLKREIERHLEANESVIVEIELEGARAIRRMLPDAVTVFIAPPSLAELARRLTDRRTDTPAEIAERLAVGERELAAMEEFDHHVVNDDVTRATGALVEIISAATETPAKGE